jgi:hypothetical protein
MKTGAGIVIIRTVQYQARCELCDEESDVELDREPVVKWVQEHRKTSTHVIKVGCEHGFPYTVSCQRCAREVKGT